MLFNELNEDNFLLFAIKNYENPQAVTREDFEKDLNHFRYVKRLLKKYKNTGQLKVHLILNHFIILYNVFGEAATPMLFHKIEIDLWPVRKSVISFRGELPEHPEGDIQEVQVDINCLSELYKIYNGQEETSENN